ncbi:E3 ubiquitin-protein ligase RGLG1 [Camellia lanceoleosa]|uniref:E3 ubiquitin-protein ligase RGLG1 n=1 Tax=Camellia lanceoleosa TaxID=1840588 RepID=A0ACC0I2Q0_9ERIC|nr:E3 ubiquitin-protein ligase RGLG1 [Camellia lanceoleosa]
MDCNKVFESHLRLVGRFRILARKTPIVIDKKKLRSQSTSEIDTQGKTKSDSHVRQIAYSNCDFDFELERDYITMVVSGAPGRSDQVMTVLALSGLETANLIVGMDFTRTNKWTGATSFHGRSLHHIALMLDRDIFSFYPDKRICNGFEEVLKRYKELVPHLKLSGPTSFAPIIEMAITIVEQSDCQYHVLAIIADGPVTGAEGSFDPSPLEEETIDAIVNAREYPLTIIVVGVGDGPWDTMKNVLGHRFVRNCLLKSASLIQRLWHLVADIRLAVIVRKIFSYVPFVKAPAKPG